jgi:hypothetical protein
VAHADSSAPQAVTQVRQIGGADIAQFDALAVVPDALIGVQVWGVAWQPLQLQALGGSRAEEVLDGLAVMDRRPVGR